MKVLITGGAGYIGTELVHAIDNDSNINEIIVYDNLSRPNYNLFLGGNRLSNKVKFVNGEILDSRKLGKLVENCDAVVHLAAMVKTPFADDNHHLFEQINHWGTAGVIDAVEDAKVPLFINLSSVSVYGSSLDEMTLDSEPQPQTIYGISKLRGEEQVSRLEKKAKTFNLRCANVYGYNRSMRFDAVINRFMFGAHFGNKISIQGNGEQQRAFVHVNNVARAIHTLLTDASFKSGTYHLVDRNAAVMDLVETLQRIYPDLEMVFTSQHLTLRSLKVQLEEALNQKLGMQTRSLEDELHEFKTNFAF
tara:strand:- start:45819 stop:46736 length:918 start_codon:yes stop_codon:yes gene_type:complete